ncbi:Ty3/gypsy retrotransposon protein [Senna tora]|uniref:Ty3/gypsy retrotransposon protein n=1 Tax=Senna tora TaxID=362788 RepID=A0A835CA88_9FABA|nr:Ty3/gypsy retrotransposon protein [Senna tora]
MADNTRSKELTVRLDKLQETLEERDQRYGARFEQVKRAVGSFERLEKTVEAIARAVDPYQPFHTRSVKLDFPRFDGSEALHWLFKAEKFFAYYDTPDEQRVTIAAVHFEGVVVPWFQMMSKTSRVTTWVALSKAIEVEFGPSQFESPRALLFKLYQRASATDFYREFMILATRVEGMSDEALLDCFVSGLKPAIRWDAPSSLLRAAALACLFDERSMSGYSSSHRASFNPSTSLVPVSSTPPPLLVSSSTSLVPVSNTPSTPAAKIAGPASLPPLLSTPNVQPLRSVKRMSTTEIQLRREKKLCFTCDAPYSWSHKCPNRQFMVLQIEQDDEGDPVLVDAPSEPSPPDPQPSDTPAHHLSLNALSGDHAVGTIRFTGYDITVSAHVLEVKGADMILGAQWLATLGPHIADYSTATIKFYCTGQFVTLHGESKPIANVAQFHHLKRLTNTDAICAYFAIQPHHVDPDPTRASFTDLLPADLQTLLQRFSVVLEVPRGQPPQRSHDHQILLQDDKPVRVLTTLAQQCLYAKLSKCVFGQSRIEYLGHFVSAQGVEMDPAKVRAVVEWPTPSTVKQLRGFLGLSGYYRRFIQSYASIAAPLTSLLKKDEFQWSDDVTSAFSALKTAITTAPILVLPDFSKPFTIEMYALGMGVGVVLSQKGRPIVFFSKKMSTRMQNRSAYAREMFAITEAIAKFRHYLIGHFFTIRTDQKSLRHLTDQTLQTPEQEEWLHKLLGFQFPIEYKPGKLNIVADALSRSCYVPFSTLVCSILDEVRQAIQRDPDLMRLLTQCTDHTGVDYRYTVKDGVLYWKGRIVVPPAASQLMQSLLHEYHTTPIGGHAGHLRTYARLAALFYWFNMRSECLEMYLRYFVLDKPSGWFPCLSWAEYWYNTAYHIAIGMTLFKAVYGRDPPQLTHYIPDPSDAMEVRDQLLLWDEILQQLRVHLQRSQDRMKLFADRKRSELQFQVGDSVFVRLQPYRQHSVHLRRNQKLGMCYFGPFTILERIGEVAYRLQLPPHAKIHDIFHVSQLKQCIGSAASVHIPLPLLTTEQGPVISPPFYSVARYRWVTSASLKCSLPGTMIHHQHGNP